MVVLEILRFYSRPKIMEIQHEYPVFHARTKHINNKYHYIRSLVQDGVVKLRYIPIDEQVADVLTKYLSNKKFEYFRSMLGLVDVTNLVDWER